MAGYLLIESRDPFESNDVGYYYELARGFVLTCQSHPVSDAVTVDFDV